MRYLCVPLCLCGLAFLSGAALAGPTGNQLTNGEWRATNAPGPEGQRLEVEFETAIASGDYARARELDRELSAVAGDARCGLSAESPEFLPGGPVAARAPAGAGVEVVSGPVRAFGAATDSTGAIWLAAALPDLSVRVYRSQDLGQSWDELFGFNNGTDVSRVEVVFGPGDSSFVYVFYLDSRNSGDIRAVRVGLDTVAPLALDVVVGPDTITDFSVCADEDRFHYLYLLYANERRTGRTGGFTRSLTCGKSWEPSQPWWNCSDPCVVFGTGSTVQCAWRFALTGREIHLQSNRNFGRVGKWWTYRLASGEHEQVREPVVAWPDTGREWNSRVWLAYTVARRDTQELDVACSYSADGGWTWNENNDLGAARVDEFFPDLARVPGDPAGHVYLAYTAGQRSGPGRTGTWWRAANVLDPGYWSPAMELGGLRANAGFEGCRPRLVVPAGTPHRWPGMLYSLYHPDHADGVLFAAPWLAAPPATNPGPGDGLRVMALGPGRVELFSGAPGALAIHDCLGRRVRVLAGSGGRFEWDGRDETGRALRAGAYFAAAGDGARARFALVR